ncbi:MAG: alanine racemase [Clostridiales bacterium]|nr:alanine racemase [Clostridiales bacterium]MCD8153224.1 alanine racemase [Clostridiales bacterium]
MNKYSRVKALVSLDAIAHNFEEMKNNIHEGTKIIAVIKADGYGHGALAIARLIHDYDYIWGFATATAEEALALRKNGVTKPILILGLVFPEYLEEMAREEIRLTISDLETARRFAKEGERLGKTVHIHLALDTGMTRIGYADIPTNVDKILEISRLPHVEIEGLFTHFARADETDRSPAFKQLDRYLRFSSMLESRGISIPIRHCSNSAGIIRMPEANLNAVRAGISIYGIYPSAEVERDTVHLIPAMELKSHVSFVKKVEQGTAVSYGGTYITRKTTVIATIPVGYADGYPRGLSNKGWVLIHGKKAPILGRVCMDQFMVDVTEIPNVKAGDEVTLIGRDGSEFISVETLGDLSGRFSYEFVCEISKRVPRVYIRDEKEYGELSFFD